MTRHQAPQGVSCASLCTTLQAAPRKVSLDSRGTLTAASIHQSRLHPDEPLAASVSPRTVVSLPPQLEALADPTPINFIIPIISSLGFIFILGYAAVKIVPGVLANHVVPRLPVVHLEHTLLGMVLLAGSVLMVACHYSKSSHLLGAFLGGLMFCTLSSVKSVWHHKVRATFFPIHPQADSPACTAFGMLSSAVQVKRS